MKVEKKIIPSQIVCDICGDAMGRGWSDSWVHMRYMSYASPDNVEDTKLWKMRKLDICRSCFNKFKEWVNETDS